MSFPAGRLSIRPRLAVALIAGTAVFVRLLHVLSYDPEPTNDMAVYVDMAVRRLALANLFGPEGICWFPPGYAVFLKPFFLLFAPPGALLAARIGQAVLGAWTCVLIYRLGRRIHSRRAGLAAAAAACFYPHFLFYSSAYMSENLFTPLFYAALLLFLRAASKPGGGRLYTAGVAAGAALLVRPAAVALAPAALAAAWRSGTTRAARARALALVAAGGLTLVAPWTVRNAIAYGHFVTIAPNSGFNIAIGNNPEATGRYMDPPSIRGDIWARMDDFQNRSFVFLAGDPWGALFIMARLKWQAFWEVIPPWPLYSSNPLLFAGEHFFPWISWSEALFAGTIGLGVLAAGRRPLAWITPACFAGYVAFYMAFFGGARFRMPSEGFFLVWGGAAAVAAVSLLPRLRRLRAPAWGAAVAVLIAAILLQSSVVAAGNRRFVRSDGARIAAGEQFVVLPEKGPRSLFHEESFPVDRSRGRFLKVSFTAFRQGPHRDTPNNGHVRLTFVDRTGKSLPWLDNPTYFLEALPADRWVAVSFRAHIPPQAASCRVTLTPDRGSPDTLILDQPVLRYARGNDLFLESVFPYLRYDE